MNSSSVLMTPLPKITVQRRKQKLTNKIPQMIKKLGKKRQIEILEERSQGFWIEDEVKNELDRIRLRTNRMKTMQLESNSHEFFRRDEENKKNYRRKTTLPKSNPFFKKEKQNQAYLPQLKELVLTRKNQSDSLIKAKRRKIMHLLILGLNRRNSGRLYQALDIVLLASFYFDRDDEERQLKSICLALISKLHKQIKKQSSCVKRKSKINKRRKSLTVMNYLSRQNFMQNFMQKLRKTKLVGEFSYEDNKKHKNNMRRINAKCDVMIPKPEQIFDEQLGVKNYDYVAITVDDYTNMFPYEYPKSLNQKINQFQYRQIICKLNGLLVPESKCYSFSSILKIFYLPFLLILMIMAAFTMVRTFITGETSRIFLISLTILCVLILSVKICSEQSGYTNYIEIKDKMKAYLEAWESQYEPQHIKFRMGENVDAIFIVFPSQTDKSSQSSSQLTQIQEVDENYTDNITDQINKEDFLQRKLGSLDKESIKGVRRFGSKFDEEGNLLKKVTNTSRFASLDPYEYEKGTQILNDVNRKNSKIFSIKNIDQKKKEYSNSGQLNDISQCQSRVTERKDNQKNQEEIVSKQAENSNIPEKLSSYKSYQDESKQSVHQIKRPTKIEQPRQNVDSNSNNNKISFYLPKRKKTTVRFADTPAQTYNKKNQYTVKTSMNISIDEKYRKTSNITKKSQYKNQISQTQLITPKNTDFNDTNYIKSENLFHQQKTKNTQAQNILDKIYDKIRSQ